MCTEQPQACVGVGVVWGWKKWHTNLQGTMLAMMIARLTRSIVTRTARRWESSFYRRRVTEERGSGSQMDYKWESKRLRTPEMVAPFTAVRSSNVFLTDSAGCLDGANNLRCAPQDTPQWQQCQWRKVCLRWRGLCKLDFTLRTLLVAGGQTKHTLLGLSNTDFGDGGKRENGKKARGCL
jgi:hypothetical protein